MRSEITKLLISNLTTFEDEVTSVAIVGGSSTDPEVTSLKDLKKHLRFTYFGIVNENKDLNWFHFDLNSNLKSQFSDKFDLVISCQVLEHVWNINSYFEMLFSLVSPGGFIFVNCPASNFVHGSPDYFSAGYAPNFLVRNLERVGIMILDSGSLGSRRYYFLTHIVRRWVRLPELRHPFLNYEILGGSFLGELKRFIKEIPSRIYSLFLSPKITNGISYATESYVFGRKSKVEGNL